MKTYYVGGKHFLNRFNNLEAAIERAQDDDTIELFKDVDDVSVRTNKNITIIGHGHIVIPADGKTAITCASFVTIKDVIFHCKPRTNALIIRNGGKLSNVTTQITGPARALYPTVIQKGGHLVIKNSHIMYMEAKISEQQNAFPMVTDIYESEVSNYYGGSVYLNDNGNSLSKFYGVTNIKDSVIECVQLGGVCNLTGTILKNFNKSAGTTKLESCLLASRRTVVDYSMEPGDGPLKDKNLNVVPYALHIAGGKVIVKDFSSDAQSDCIGFYMTDGSLDIHSTRSYNNNARHLLKGGSVVFNDVTDKGFYEIRKARCGVIRSDVNMSARERSAMQQLYGMIGLDSVKEQVRTIMNTIYINLRYPEKDFGFSHHMIFAGDPGTGKTTVAKLVAQSLFEIGAIPENKYTEMPASRLVKGFVGQTGEHVEVVMQKALGGVLFIDEAYDLMVKEGQATFNNDVISVLLRYMEDHRNNLVVIAAGYEKEMRQFLSSNLGLARRFQWVSFDNYTAKEMADIFLSMGKQYNEKYAFMDPGTLLVEYFERLTNFYLSHPDANGRVTNGGNGGLVRNLFQQIVFARNNRVAECPESRMSFIRADFENGFRCEMEKARNIL